MERKEFCVSSGVFSLVVFVLLSIPTPAAATSQWSRKTGMSCNACHTIVPRLTPFGEAYLRNGYQLTPAHSGTDYGGVFLDKVDHLFGVRVNITPFQLETNSFQKDSAEEKTTRFTIGNPIWIQFFAGGSIYKNVSFFSELEYALRGTDSKITWFYFNFTNAGGSQWLNAQVGNITPLQFASFPNRLPQLPMVRGEVMRIRSSDGKGEESVDLSSARPGFQYYGYNDWALFYAGISPGTRAVEINQFPHYWAGFVFTLPEGLIEVFDGSTATIHGYTGTDTKNTGQETASPQRRQIENKFTRISPQVNVRYDEKLDIQAAYVYGKDENWNLMVAPSEDFTFSGVAIVAGYMPNGNWHFGLHYDNYSSSNEFTTGPNAGKPLIEFERVVPVIGCIMNQSTRFQLYFEKDLSDKPSEQRVDKLYLNVRTMF